MKKIIVSVLMLGSLSSVAFADLSVNVENNNKKGVAVGLNYETKLNSIDTNLIFDTSFKIKERNESEIKIGGGYETVIGNFKSGFMFDTMADSLYVGYEKDYEDLIFGVEYSKNMKNDFYKDTIKLTVEYEINKNINVYSNYQIKKFSIDIPFGNDEIKMKSKELTFGVEYKF